MRHARLTTTEQYMAYAPRPELENQIARALDPYSLPENVTPIRSRSTASVIERLEEGDTSQVGPRDRTHLRRKLHTAACSRVWRVKTRVAEVPIVFDSGSWLRMTLMIPIARSTSSQRSAISSPLRSPA